MCNIKSLIQRLDPDLANSSPVFRSQTYFFLLTAGLFHTSHLGLFDPLFLPINLHFIYKHYQTLTHAIKATKEFFLTWILPQPR